eukprot:TRINITY_DN11056_c0_g2_i1.p1 TRINITY_DN11056_c0_g2~~TRINITY_DN11056_c0_g2_i1.p1  ORF type:complete len:151 (+),score=32.11 TRINITY_DN11056_c0_g2_i1:143-595(+)
MMSSATTANAPVEELYELCVRNGFVDARPVKDHGLARNNSAPALLVSSCEMTIMLKNVPCSVTEELMTSVLKENGFADLYDYLYMPKRNASNLGFCFVNFKREEDALRFKDEFLGYKFSGINSMKQCFVSLAHVQGREANMRKHSRYCKR